jgi:hypothetical protein
MNILVADEAWLATALLHQEHPDAEDFSLDEIREKSLVEFHDPRPGVWQHIVSHCVASNPPNPAQYRMLHNSGRGRRRLYRNGDPLHPGRHGKIHPEKRDIPQEYHSVVDWYVSKYNQVENPIGSSNPAAMLKFIGLIPAYDLQKMTEAISSACERIDSNEW